MTRITDGNGNQTNFLYNLRGDMTEKHWPDYVASQTGFETYTYDDNGNLLNQAFADGMVHSFYYDSMNRVTTEIYGNEYEYRFTYTDRGELAEVRDWKADPLNGLLLTTYGYDSLSRPTTVNHAVTAGVEMSYTYDRLGNRDTMTTPAGLYDYQYDALSRVTGVTAPGSQTTNFGYDALGRLHTVERPNNVDTTYTYDARNFLTEIAHEQGLTTLAQYTYDYDLAGNRTTMANITGTITGNVTWQYDAANRLIREHNDRSGVGFDTTYQYDQNGNRTREIHANGDVTRYTYNQNDQLTKVEFPNYFTDNYSYDARGNLTSVEKKQGIVSLGIQSSYTYDAHNQMTQATVTGAGTVNFAYDYAGHRTQQSIVAGATTDYLWDEFSQFGDVVLESTGTNSISYTLANNMVLSQTQGTTTHYLLGDALNSTRALTNGSGAITDTFDYDAFGNLLGNPSSLATNYLYTGQQYDELTELYSLRARYYDPNDGRFLSRDTWAYDLSNPIELNRYVYTTNSPLNYIDPSGHSNTGGYALINQFQVVAYRVANKAMLNWTQNFVLGFVAGGIGWFVGQSLAIILRNGLSIPGYFRGWDKLGYEGENSLQYELWAALGVATDFLWAGFSGGMIEMTNAFVNEYNMVFLSAEEVMAVNAVYQSMGITFAISLSNFLKPLLDNLLTVIPYGATTPHRDIQEAKDTLWSEIRSDYIVESVNVIVSSLAAGGGVMLTNALAGLAQKAGIPGSRAFFSMLAYGFISNITATGGAVATRTGIDNVLH